MTASSKIPTEKPRIDIDPESADLPDTLVQEDDGLDVTGFAPRSRRSTTPTQARAVKAVAIERGFTREIQSERLDGRSLRRTGRTLQINIKCTPETRRQLFEVCQKHDISVAEAFEEAIQALAEKYGK
jgi:hypothetical protein